MRESAKYPKTKVIEAVRESRSFAEVMRKLDKKWSGGQQQNLKRWIKIYEIDTSHFVGAAWAKGLPGKKKHWSKFLVLSERTFREKASNLRRALIESGRDYKCACCGMGPEWLGKPLVLEVDHKNKIWRDNRAENLEFLCPNCHTVKTQDNRESVTMCLSS